MLSNSSTFNKDDSSPESSSRPADPPTSTETDNSQQGPIADMPEQDPVRARLRENLFKRTVDNLVRMTILRSELTPQREHGLRLKSYAENALSEVRRLEHEGNDVLLEEAKYWYRLAFNACHRAANQWDTDPRLQEYKDLVQQTNAMTEMWNANGFE